MFINAIIDDFPKISDYLLKISEDSPKLVLKSPECCVTWILWVVYFPVKHSCLFNKQYYVTELIDVISLSWAPSILHEINFKTASSLWKHAKCFPYMFLGCQSFFVFVFPPTEKKPLAPRVLCMLCWRNLNTPDAEMLQCTRLLVNDLVPPCPLWL